MLAVTNEFRRLSIGVNPQKMDKNIRETYSPYIVIERNLNFPEIKNGYCAAQIERQGKGEGTPAGFEITYYFMPAIMAAGSEDRRQIEIKREALTTFSKDYPNAPHLDKYSDDESMIIADSAALDIMIKDIAGSMQIIMSAAVDPALNPKLAPRLQDFYLELQQMDQSVNIS